MSDKELADLQNRIGYRFNDIRLLTKSLTHRSLNKNESFERLEFLGDRVLGLAVANYLFLNKSKSNEGDMTSRLVELVRRETLYTVASDIELVKYIKHCLPRQSVSREIEKVLADSCEALIGAIFIDGGWIESKKFVWKMLNNYWEAPIKVESKSRSLLQEWSQSKGYDLPSYTVLQQTGTDHNPMFTVKVAIDEVGDAIGTGYSKKTAYKNAAEKLLNIANSKQHSKDSNYE